MLRAVYPYGLNDWLRDEYKKYDAYVLVFNKFPPISTRHNRISRASSHKNNNYLSPEKLIIKLKHYLRHKLSDVSNFSRVSLLSMNEYNLTSALLQDILNDARNSIY